MAWAWGGYAATAITERWTTTFDIVVKSWSDHKLEDALVIGIGFPAGQPGVSVTYLGTVVVDGTTYNQFQLRAGPPPGPGWPGVATTVNVAADDSVVTWAVTLWVDAVVKERTGVQPLDAKVYPTCAKERAAQDAWGTAEGQEWYASIGPISATSTTDATLEPSAGVLSIGVVFSLGKVTGDAWRIDSITIEDAPIDASQLDEEITPYSTGGSYTDVKPRVYGSGASIICNFPAVTETAAFSWGGDITAPHVYTFTGLGVWYMDGTLIGSLLVTCPAVQIYTAGEWVAVTQSVTAWRAYTAIPDYGIYSWDAEPPPEGALRVLPTVHFYIDRDSGRAHLLEGFTEDSVVGRSFLHDARIIINGWPINKTSRDASPFDDGIASLAHRDNVGLYGDTDVLGPTDWAASAGTTAPGVGGDFVVTAAGATLTLTPVSNYFDRLQVQVPAETAPQGVPGAYITRRHNAYIAPWATNPETPETPYCGLGWRYMEVPADVPAACDLTCTVAYYGDESHSDNHLSDSTRQTSYVYTPGDVSSLSRTVSLEAGAGQVVLFDLSSDKPLRIIKSVRLTFGAAGDWAIGEPELVLDPGDGDREAVTPHSYVKTFEHFANLKGGISATVDGQHDEALAWPDTVRGNTLEQTAGYYDPVTGAVSGLDLSAAYFLSTYMPLIGLSSEAWTGTHNAAAEAAATTDDEDNVLKVLSCSDLRPVMGSEPGALDVAIRVAQWTAAPGILYDWSAEKFVHGQGHGWAGSAAAPARGGGGALYRRAAAEDDWAHVEDISADQHGHWLSDGHEVVAEYDNGAATLFSYATGRQGLPLVGRFATREWAQATLGALAHLHLSEHTLGPVYLVDADAGDVGFRWRKPGAGWQARVAVTGSSDAEIACALLSVAQGPNILRDTASAVTMHEASRITGAWLAQVALESGYAYPDGVYAWNRWYVSAYKDGSQWLLRRDRDNDDYGAVDAREIAASDARVAALFGGGPYSRLLCAVESGGSSAIYGSNDLGATWAELVDLGDWEWPRLVSRGNILWLMGEVDGEVRVQRRLLGTAALTVLPYHTGDTVSVVAPSDGHRPALLAMRAYNDLVCVLQSGGGLVEYRSRDMGASWARESTIA